MLKSECLTFRSRYHHLLLFVCVCLLFAACGGSTATFLVRGNQYLEKRKFHDALMQFRAAAESSKDSAEAHWGMARAFENLGQFSETLEELRKTVELDETNLDAKAKLANYFLIVQPPLVAEAERIRDEILTTDPNFVEGHILTASILAAQGKPDKDVINVVNNAIAREPGRIESYISLQRLYMTREKPSEAEEAIRRGIAASPSSIKGYTEYGRFLMYANRDPEAETQFLKAIKIASGSIEAREAAAEFYVTSKQLDKAENAYRELVNIQEHSPESELVLADFYNKTGRDTDAVNVLTQVLAAAPEYSLARYRLAEIHLNRKAIPEVNTQLDALFKLNEDDVEALMLRSRVKMHQGDAQSAVQDLEEVLKQRPSGKEPLFLIAEARLALGQIDQANAFIADLERYHPGYLKTGLLKIQAAFATGDPATALKMANDLVQKTTSARATADQDSQGAHELFIRGLSSRGLAQLELGDLASAKAELEGVVKLAPRSTSAKINLAKVFIAERNYSEALGLYESAFNTDNRSFDAINGIVNMSVRLNQFVSAHNRIDQLIASNQGRHDFVAALHYLKSTIYAAEKNNAAAEVQLNAAISLDENYLPAYSAYAALLVQQNRADEAVQQYKRILDKSPVAQTYTMLGILQDSLGRTNEAENSYRKALELSPESPIAANNLAWIIADNRGNLDEALRLATMAVAKDQSIASFHDTLGWVYLKKGLGSPAVEQFKKAVVLDDSATKKSGTQPNPEYRVRLGMALATADGRGKARI
ncbi:MAG: tetratricopeptide repeat protein [Pyrinomonadaceae bacterium]